MSQWAGAGHSFLLDTEGKEAGNSFRPMVNSDHLLRSLTPNSALPSLVVELSFSLQIYCTNYLFLPKIPPQTQWLKTTTISYFVLSV